MLKRLFLATAIALAIGIAAPAAAQDPTATVLLKSGERITGTFEGILNGIMYVRVSFPEQRRIPVGDVALVDFLGNTRNLPQAELVAVRGGPDFVVLRDGSSLRGDLVEVVRAGGGVEATTPLVFVFRSQDGMTRQLRAGDVARMYLGPVPDLTTTPEAVATTGTVARSTRFGPNDAGWVAASTPWTPTGIFVRAGDFLIFGADGEVKLGEGHIASPAGSRLRRYSGLAPIPNELMGALIARIDNAPLFAIGDITTPIKMPATGSFTLG